MYKNISQKEEDKILQCLESSDPGMIRFGVFTAMALGDLPFICYLIEKYGSGRDYNSNSDAGSYYLYNKVIITGMNIHDIDEHGMYIMCDDLNIYVGHRISIFKGPINERLYKVSWQDFKTDKL